MSLAVTNVYALCPAGDLDALIAHSANATALPSFTGRCDPAEFKELSIYLPGVSLRRVPHPVKLALKAALKATDSRNKPEALILATAYGAVGSTFEFLDSLIADGADLASPTAFSHSVANMTAAYLSQFLKLTGPCFTLTQPSFMAALETAEVLLLSGQAGSVLLGSVSEYSDIMAAIEKESNQATAALSEAAVFFLLGLPSGAHGELLIDCRPKHKTMSAKGTAAPPLTLQALHLALNCRLAALHALPTNREICCGPGSIQIRLNDGGEKI